MAIYNSILEAVGRTPLIKLNRMTEGLKAVIYVKAENLNPGGSVKDRTALRMIESAERAGLLKKGGTIIEATAGNTGVGLAIAAAVKNYRAIFVIPDKMSRDKIDLIKAYGAEVVITPTSVAPDSPESYNGVAERLSREIPGAFRPNQFGNLENPAAHYYSTGREIWDELGDEIDYFVAGMGTGGTISGISSFLKEKKQAIITIGADPEGSVLSGDSPKSYKVEGIGEDFVPYTFNRQMVDEMIRVSDKESFLTARRLAREEGILAGGSSGTALAAALKFAERLKEKRTMVVILPDTGRNYLSKIFSDDWMRENGFCDANVKETSAGNVAFAKEGFPPVISAAPDTSIAGVIMTMQKYNISQLPVIEGERQTGSLNESSVLKLLHDGTDLKNIKASAVMGKPFPEIDADTAISEAYRLLLAGHGAVLVSGEKGTKAIITKTDIMNYYAANSSKEVRK